MTPMHQRTILTTPVLYSHELAPHDVARHLRWHAVRSLKTQADKLGLTLIEAPVFQRLITDSFELPDGTALELHAERMSVAIFNAEAT